MYESEKESLLIKLEELEAEHTELDNLIDMNSASIDEVTLQRIKKRRLYLKDKITEIKSFLEPDIIA